MLSLDALDRAASRVSRLIALLGLTGLMVLALATVLDVLMRWVFNAPITGIYDASFVFISVIIASGFALCIAERGNITIRFLGNAFGIPVKNYLEAFGHFVTLIVFVAIAWQFWEYAKELSLDGETTMVLGWHLSPWWRIVAILFAVCVPVQAVVFLQTSKSAIFGESSADKMTMSNDDNGEDS